MHQTHSLRSLSQSRTPVTHPVSCISQSPGRPTRHSPRGKATDRFGEHDALRKSSLGRAPQSPGETTEAKAFPIGGAGPPESITEKKSPTRRRTSGSFKSNDLGKGLASGVILEAEEAIRDAEAKDKLDIEQPATPPKDSEGPHAVSSSRAVCLKSGTNTSDCFG
jgi:hypothetical protein